MKLRFTVELEATLARLAAESGRRAEELVEDLVRNYVDHDEWFRQEVGKGQAQLDRGEFIDNDKVIAGIERLFES